MIPFYLDGWMNGVVATLNDDSIQDDRIDRSLMRILSFKEDLGMFTNELDQLFGGSFGYYCILTSVICSHRLCVILLYTYYVIQG
jgi:hypothetical protein